jgi:hypothetical protein
VKKSCCRGGPCGRPRATTRVAPSRGVVHGLAQGCQANPAPAGVAVSCSTSCDLPRGPQRKGAPQSAQRPQRKIHLVLSANSVSSVVSFLLENTQKLVLVAAAGPRCSTNGRLLLLPRRKRSPRSAQRGRAATKGSQENLCKPQAFFELVAQRPRRSRGAIQNSRFKIRDLASGKLCQKSNRLRSCITEEDTSAVLCELCGLCGESPLGLRPTMAKAVVDYPAWRARGKVVVSFGMAPLTNRRSFPRKRESTP